MRDTIQFNDVGRPTGLACARTHTLVVVRYDKPVMSPANGYAYRYGKWKMVAGGISCDAAKATFNCSKPQLYDMSTDYAENHDLADTYPEARRVMLVVAVVVVVVVVGGGGGGGVVVVVVVVVTAVAC